MERTTKNTPVSLCDLNHRPTEDEMFRVRLKNLYGTSVLESLPSPGAAPGLSNVTNSTREYKTPARRGSKGLTSHGRAIVFNAIDYLQWRFGRSSLSFGTVTIPSVTPEQNAAITKEWSRIIDLFTKYIRRKLHVQGLPDWIVGAHEIQTSRLSTHGLACLHFHFVIVARRSRGAWGITHKEVRELWRRAVVSRVPSLADVSFSACEHLVAIRKSVASYLSKYLTKGSGVVGDVDAPPDSKHPHSWHSCSLSLRRIVARSTRSGRHIGAFLSGLGEESWIYKKAVKIKGFEGEEFVVGWYGQLLPGWSRLLDVPVHVPVEEGNPLVFQFPLPKRFHDGYVPIVLSVAITGIPVFTECKKESKV
jgi:hypothetical protein